MILAVLGGVEIYSLFHGGGHKSALMDSSHDQFIDLMFWGELHYSLGDLAGAFHSYQASLAVIRDLVDSDPSNAVWQSELSVSLHKLGDVLLEQGDLLGALQSYEAECVNRFETL